MRSLRTAVAALLLATPATMMPACGARTGLRVGDAGAPTPRNGFCGSASYRSGYSSLSIYILLDKSGSMNDDNKWDEATSALSAFVSDPVTNGLGVGLAYFPIENSCNIQTYELPAVPIAPLPGNADKIKNSLAAQKPDGETPTRLALRAAIEYARARQIANPHEEVAIALVTDGVPNACDSSVENVADVALDGVKTTPQVLTFVIGQEAASESGLARIASAGGTGKPIIVGKSPDSAQKLVNALEGLKNALGTCQFAIPDAGSVALLPSDVTVSYAVSGGSATALPRIAGAAACSGANGFYVDDPAAPSRIQLCPGVCNALHQNPESRVEVTAGCGGHSDAGARDAGTIDGGGCDGVVSFSCTPKCGSGQLGSAICLNTYWTCPPGTVRTDTCASCPAVPHGCCKTDGTVGVASCVNGTWVCPPGGKLFGEPGCRPPDVCTELLPCAEGQYCKVPDFSCGKGTLPGKCEAIPPSCPGGGVAVCGCGGTEYPSQCAAAADGTDLSTAGNCTAPAGTFACGPYFCNAQSETCEHGIDLTKTQAQNSYACVAGTGCGPLHAPCVCPKGHKCGSSCAQNGAGTTVTCTTIL